MRRIEIGSVGHELPREAISRPAGREEQAMSGSCSMAQSMKKWPNCAVPDCPNKSCLSLHSEYCWPHTVGQPFNCHEGMTDQEIEEFNALAEGEYFARIGGQP